MAAKMGSGSWVLAILLALAVMVTVSEVKMVNGQTPSPSQCKEEQRLGVSACRPILLRQSPSAACCQRVRVSHYECICPAVTAKIAALIDVKTAIKLLQSCGRQVPRRFKCGSLNFP